MFTFTKENTFCISISETSTRWEKMKRRFGEINLDVSRWQATLPDQLKNNYHHMLSIKQKACTESHVLLWKHIIDNKLPYALITEDDACFDKNWREKLSKFNAEKDPLWDLLLLNASEPISIQDEWVLQKDQYLCAGYILSQKGAQTLINHFSPSFYMSDWMTVVLQTYNHSYSYFPWLVIQEGSDTLINGNLIEDHEKVVRCLENIGYSLDNYIV